MRSIVVVAIYQLFCAGKRVNVGVRCRPTCMYPEITDGSLDGEDSFHPRRGSPMQVSRDLRLLLHDWDITSPMIWSVGSRYNRSSTGELHDW